MLNRCAFPALALLLLLSLALLRFPHRPSSSGPSVDVTNPAQRGLSAADASPTMAASHQRTGQQGAPAGDSALEGSNSTADLLTSLRTGNPVSLSLEGSLPETFLFRPRPAVGDSFALRLGPQGPPLKASIETFEGFSTNPSFRETTATLALAGKSIGMVVRRANAEITYVRSHPRTGQLQARTETFAALDTLCAASPADPRHFHLRSDDPLPDGKAFWRDARDADLVPATAALTGFDPATNRLDKYINRIPQATRYDTSLKDALMLLVLDKEATGSSSVANLTSKASLFLATVSNVAAVYENQLGIRLLVQEMIMIPDSDDYDDVPSDGIEDFLDWLVLHRLNRTYGWSMASKFGAGLEGQTLGVAYVRATSNTSAVSVCQSTARWDVLAHEIGHNLGSEHSSGGLMNASSSGGTIRTFFTDVTPGETSAKDMYDYVESGTSRLYGEAKLRHPEEIPFANRDFEATPIDRPVTLSPLGNDEVQMRNGRVNLLSLEEVSAVIPLGAGTAKLSGNQIRFTPSPGFEGTAWFSYSLRGNVGNAGKGWLHKGDVAVRVGAVPDPLSITLAPGASYSFQPAGGTSGLTQPSQAIIDRSRDETSLLIIRVKADASGLETFRAGGRTYTLRYDAPSPRVTDDRYLYDVQAGRLTFNPLLNDEGAGEPWLNPIRPTLVVGTDGHDPGGDALFPTTFRLASITNLTPEKGSLSTRTLPFIIDGRRDNRLDSTVTFTARSGASGSALLEYSAEDATGRRAKARVEIILPFRIETLVTVGDTARYHFPSNDTDEATWMNPGFDDRAWESGPIGLGYDTGADYLSEIATPLPGFRNVTTSLWVRLPFHADQVAQFTNMALRIKSDDGFVAYLNGQEVARSPLVPEVPTPLPWNASTTSSTSDSQALTFTSYDLSDWSHLLNEGDNLLAIHGLNASLTSSDFLLVPELEASVTASGIQRVAPQIAEVSLLTDTWLSLEIEPAGAAAGGPVTWSVIEGSPGQVEFQNAESAQTAARFFLPGTYRLQAFSSAGGTTESIDLIVEVLQPGNPATFPLAASVQLPGDFRSTRLINTLTASVSPVEGASLQWSQLSGPETALFENPRAAETAIATTADGDYHFRLSVDRHGVTTFADLRVLVNLDTADPNNIGAFAMQPSQVGPASATFQGSALLLHRSAEATWFWGTADGGTHPEQWAHQRDLGPVGRGPLSAPVSDLLFQTTYHYRLRLSTGGLVVWSPPVSFVTQDPPLRTKVLVDEASPALVHVPADASEDLSWRELAFNDASWTEGSSRVGYDLDTEFLPWIDTNIQDAMYSVSTSAYLRVPFQLDSVNGIRSLLLRIRYDDAFIAYLNGAEIARSATAPQTGELDWESIAAIQRDDVEAVVPENYELTQHRHLLRSGANLLAIQGLNNVPLNRDLLIAPILEVERQQTYLENWARAVNLPENASDPSDDPDGDGFPNLLEYALGGDPVMADSPTAYSLRLARNAESGSLEIAYRRRSEAPLRGLTFTLESSGDLATWQAETDALEAVSAQNSMEHVLLTLPAGTTGNGHNELANYWRLAIAMSGDPFQHQPLDESDTGSED